MYWLEKDTVHQISRCYSEVPCASYIVTHMLILYPHSRALYHDGQRCQHRYCYHRRHPCQPQLAISSATDLLAQCLPDCCLYLLIANVVFYLYIRMLLTVFVKVILCLLTFKNSLILIKIYLFFFLQNLEESLGN